jgi:hypothetical protein
MLPMTFIFITYFVNIITKRKILSNIFFKRAKNEKSVAKTEGKIACENFNYIIVAYKLAFLH